MDIGFCFSEIFGMSKLEVMPVGAQTHKTRLLILKSLKKFGAQKKIFILICFQNPD